MDSAKDVTTLAVNIINYAGKIYDSTYYLIKYVKMSRPEVLDLMTTRDYYFRLGVYFGINFNSVFTASPKALFEL